MSKEGIKVKRPNDIIYFLFATEPLTFMLFLIEFLISMNIKIKNINKKIIFIINTNYQGLPKVCIFVTIALAIEVHPYFLLVSATLAASWFTTSNCIHIVFFIYQIISCPSLNCRCVNYRKIKLCFISA